MGDKYLKQNEFGIDRFQLIISNNIFSELLEFCSAQIWAEQIQYV